MPHSTSALTTHTDTKRRQAWITHRNACVSATSRRKEMLKAREVAAIVFLLSIFCAFVVSPLAWAAYWDQTGNPNDEIRGPILLTGALLIAAGIGAANLIGYIAGQILRREKPSPDLIRLLQEERARLIETYGPPPADVAEMPALNLDDAG